MTLDETILEEAKQAREQLIGAEHEVDRMRADYNYAIRRLHSAGGSLREIADALGLSHQRVHQIVDAEAKGPAAMPFPLVCPPPRGLRGKRGRGFFTRFSGDAREVVVRAQTAADVLRHDYIGTEHLLLGLIDGKDEPAVQALGALGVDLAVLRGAIVAKVGEGPSERRPGRRPFTRRAKRALELGLRAALERGDMHIGTEHVLLGLLGEGHGTAAEILGEFGVTPGRLREQLAA